MVLKDIMAISGEAGLFKFIAKGKNSVIVEHLETGKRTSAFNMARISSLEEISIFTENEDLPLSKVLDLIHDKEKGGHSIDYKSDPEKLKEYFSDLLPEYDKDRVYVSDIRKIIQWYNILQLLNLLVKEEPGKEQEKDKENEINTGKGTGDKQAEPSGTEAAGVKQTPRARKPSGAAKAAVPKKKSPNAKTK
jgi:hypothetical protein